jgi:pimeloyl-ACP methyl ester carboxylesterase
LVDLKLTNRKLTDRGIIEHNVTFGSNGIKLNGTFFLPSDAQYNNRVPAAIMCHGYGSEGSVFESSAREIAAEGIAVLTFDFRGHGDSGGELDGSIVDDVTDAWEFVYKQPQVDRKRIGLIGHSMGAFSAIMAAGKLKNVKMLIALACPAEVKYALANPRHFVNPLISQIVALIFKIHNRINKLKIRVDWKKFLAFWHRMKPSDALASLEDCSKLFVFCLNDIASPYQKFLPAYAVASEPKQIIVFQGNHKTPIEMGELHNQWIKWAIRSLHGTKQH